MWAQCLTAPRTLEMIEVPAPDPGGLADGQVIVRMEAGAICGSDLPVFNGGIAASRGYSPEEHYGRIGAPLHEVVGEVVASTSDLEVGQRVVGWAGMSDALAEQIVANAHSLVPLTGLDHLSPVEQTLVQPLACVLHALKRIQNLPGKRVAVFGLGPIGVLYCHTANAKGAAKVVGVDPTDRADIADFFGLSESVAMPSERWLFSDYEAPEVVIDAVGHQVATLNHAIQAIAPEGQILYYGVVDDPIYPIEMRLMQRKELTLMSSTTPTKYRRGALMEAQSYLKDYPDLAKQYFTDIYDFANAQQAFECAVQRRPDKVKVGISWPG
jgi:L-iditol 2-dehydrogenase